MHQWCLVEAPLTWKSASELLSGADLLLSTLPAMYIDLHLLSYNCLQVLVLSRKALTASFDVMCWSVIY